MESLKLLSNGKLNRLCKAVVKFDFSITNWLKIKNQIFKNRKKIDILKTALIDHRLIEKKKIGTT